MRSLADTLPTLRDSAAAAVPFGDGLRLTPPLSARGGSPRGEAPPRPANLAAVHEALAQRQKGEPTDRSNPADTSRIAVAPFLKPRSDAPTSPIPPIGGLRERVEDRIAAAVAEARQEADTARAAAVELARKVERDVAARALAEARATWCNEEAARIMEKFEEAFDSLHKRLSDAFAQALLPIAGTEIRDIAVRRFAAVLDDLIGRGADAPSVTVRGPADLVAALRTLMGEDAGVTFAEAEATEIVCDIGDTRLETTIGAWAEDLARAMGHSNVGQ